MIRRNLSRFCRPKMDFSERFSEHRAAMSATSQGTVPVSARPILRWSCAKQDFGEWLSRVDGHEGGKKEKLNSERSRQMRKYLPIALGLVVFATTPAPARTILHTATESTQNLHMSAIPLSQVATNRVGAVERLHKSVDTPDLDCVQHSFGINIALAC